MDNKFIIRCFLKKKNDCFDDIIVDMNCNFSIEIIFSNKIGIFIFIDYVKVDNFDW